MRVLHLKVESELSLVAAKLDQAIRQNREDILLFLKTWIRLVIMFVFSVILQSKVQPDKLSLSKLLAVLEENPARTSSKDSESKPALRPDRSTVTRPRWEDIPSSRGKHHATDFSSDGKEPDIFNVFRDVLDMRPSPRQSRSCG